MPNGAIIDSTNYCKKTFSTSVTDNEYSDCLYDDVTTKYLTPLGLRGGEDKQERLILIYMEGTL